MRFLFLGILMVWAGLKASGQELVFTVQDKDTKKPVELVYINVYSPAHSLLQTAQTDEIGMARITINKYPVTIEAIATGYESVVMKFQSAPVVASQSIELSKRYTSLNEVVITGLNRPEKLKNALSSYKVISKATIQAQGAVTLDEVMKTQMNSSISNDQILGSSINMQGMGGDKVKILIDGIPVNGREAGNINLSQLNMANTERVEIIQGPMSVVYGTDALGGVINVITKKETKPLSFNAGWYNEFIGKYNFDGSLSFSVKKQHHFTIGGGRNFFEGYKPIYSTLTYHGNTILSQRSLFFKPKEQYMGNFAYGYTSKSGFNLNFLSDYLKEKVSNKGNLTLWDPFQGARAFDEYYRTTRSLNRLSMDGKLGKTGHWQSQNGFSVYDRKRSSILKDMVTLKEAPTNNPGDQDTTRFNDVSLRGSYSDNAYKVSYTAGYDINLSSAFSGKINGHHKTVQDYAVYATANMPVIKERLTAQAGVRVAYNTVYHPPVVPSLNLLYTPLKNLQVRASYAQGFRAPSLKEQYLEFIDLNHHILGNENLKAESGRHAQLSASYQFYEKGPDYLQAILTGYFNDVNNEIVLSPVYPDDSNSIDYVYANRAHVRNTIGTLQIDGQKKNFHFQAGYSLNHTFKEGNAYNAFSASEVTANLQYTWRRTGLSFNVFYKYTGRQPFLSTDVAGVTTSNGIQDGYNLCDASIGKSFWVKRFQLTAGVKNLFNIETPLVTGQTVSNGPHGAQGAGSFLPRSIFTSLRISLD